MGLNLLSTTNLDYFQPHHQSEVFRLKGMFLAALDDADSAHTLFSASLCLWKQNPEGWLAWGQACDRSYESAAAQAMAYQQQVAAAAAANLPPPPPPPAPPLQPHNYLEYAVYCYMQVWGEVEKCRENVGKMDMK